MFAPLDVSGLSAAWAATFAAVAVKAFVLLALALAGSFLLRRAAASTRHFLWTATIVGLLALPFLGRAVPGWSVDGLTVPRLGATAADTGPVVVEEISSPATWHLTLREQIEDGSRAMALTASDEAPTGLASDPNARVQPLHFTMIEAADEAADSPASIGALWNATRTAMRGWTPWTWALLTWELGVLVVLGWLAAGWIGLRRLERRSHRVTDPRWLAAAEVAADEMGLRRVPTLLRTDDAMTPLVWGALRAKVLVPANADDWSEERRIDVLRHEFAHVQRRDVLTQLLAQIACAVLWFHPLPWIAASRMRLERERACDDRVLLAGSLASSYAGHLLDMARTLRSEHGLAAASIGMARRSQLGERMDSLLDHRPRPRATSPWTRIVLASFVIALLLPLAALQPASLEAAPPENQDDRNPYPAPELPLRTDRAFPSVAAVPSVPAVRAIGRAPDAPRTYVVGTPRARTFVGPEVPAVVSGNAFSFMTNGKSMSSDGTLVTNEDGAAARHATWKLRSDDLELEVEMDGLIRFADDDRDLEIQGDEGYFDLYFEEGRDRRRMEIEIDGDGNEVRRYSVRGREAEIDDDARDWFANALSTFMIHAGIRVEQRVDRWLREDGFDGVVSHIEDIDFEMPAAEHWAVLLVHEELDDGQRDEVLTQIERSIDSDFTMTRLLDRTLVFLTDRPELADGTIGLIDSIDSDFERGRAIRAALSIEGMDPEIAERILILADGMDSDFEKARVLTTVPHARLRPDGGQDAFFRVLRGVDSDFEKTRALIEALPLALGDADARAQMWRAIEDMDSDFEKARVISALASRLDDDAMVIEAFEAIRSIDSDFEKARVLGEFVDPAARSEEVRDAFIRVAESIDSDFEYGRVMSQLRNAGR